ncbi:carnitine dehydratase [Bradyrhizobium japonicum]|uniref:Carnitine dehydratase n=1 Tax=Bradyrhizobium japonicum TaxID=375 RepID=A0A0A3YYX6_BRAJP|nr:CoA transferase [Bradyrhizobium japonicum]KGT78853.1 carnitine dehydratase [Bradyrhizobium japonicum]MCS3897971.1 crotonobetainyl-CoA:carnitine CoA-transferase CaiB-like acyl-CoA transferase [Bradyrhizobium japonicum USDA 38]MCS3941025.1 crotonobetainyl-CoA:carnitine CoA-transferase CaiB-like acyl-CoA transferase [Bradyrhizobium japonicum]MCW2216924.1 crotonobetainyl-CoA:carnitine CoA-transferase CaiB-like acyl-CoA transferase [Bradyrhizobium japonicum]MCW2341540.1 crotonobetainyl-CoA:carni
MQSPADILNDLWTSIGGDKAALERVRLTGEEPQIPSSFRVAVAGQTTIAAAGLAAAEIWRLRGGGPQDVSVDMRHAVAECRSERYLRLDDKPPPPAWDAIAGVYKTGDNRFVRCHTNFPHHRDAVCNVLGCEPERDKVQAALMQWKGEDFETAAYAAGGVVALMRSYDEWSALPQARALAELPLVSIEKIGEAPPKPWPQGLSNGDRPLSGLRVLDLSRVIAGPVAGRTLAAHGADVLLVSGPELPAIPWLTIDTGRGKLTTLVELRSEAGRAQLRELLKGADIFSQGYRPRALAALGFAPEDAANINPGIVYVTLSAYGHAGPWAERRGFDSLVQTTTGFNHAEGQAAGIDGPKELPAQMLDHATGYLMAFGAMMAKARQAREGGSWHVRVSLAQTGRWLWNLGRLDGGLDTPDLTGEAVHAAFIEAMPSGFGTLKAVRHSALLSTTPGRWSRPAMPLGSHPPQWPARN